MTCSVGSDMNGWKTGRECARFPSASVQPYMGELGGKTPERLKYTVWTSRGGGLILLFLREMSLKMAEEIPYIRQGRWLLETNQVARKVIHATPLYVCIHCSLESGSKIRRLVLQLEK